MDVNKFELTEKQKEVMINLINGIKELAKRICEAFKEAITRITEAFNLYVSNLTPKKRYRFLKVIGVKDYEPFFKTKVYRCRSNC